MKSANGDMLTCVFLSTVVKKQLLSMFIYRCMFVCIYAHTYTYSGGIVCACRFLYTLYNYILRV